ncbi:hypothetical protein EDC04DRAFT_2897954 [Pisolithus marmoratus]|nr:hypothetical protein EDC04DRAFT_2897954 [Pisolithus marmoratus]
MFYKFAAVLTTLLAIYVYRSGRALYHHVLTVPALPKGYFAGGDYRDHCVVIKDEIDNRLTHCEHLIFWDHLDEEDSVTNRLVLLPCDPGRRAWNTVMGPMDDPDPSGDLWIYSTKTGSLSPITLANYPEGHDFHPLGMDVYPSKAGAPSNLFVINHARQNSTIEQLVLDPAQPTVATYVRTLTSPYFVAPNSLALTSPTSFYLTNDHLMTCRLPGLFGSILPTIETIGGPPLTWVAHITVLPDGAIQHKFAALGIAFANGVALSHDGLYLAVASSSLAKVHFYRRDPLTNELTHDRDVNVPFGSDNVMYDDDDTLIVAGHPHFPTFMDVVANKPGAKAPSWAVSIRPVSAGGVRELEGQKDPHSKTTGHDSRAPLSASVIAPASSTDEVETIFQSDGSVYGTSTTGLIDTRTGTFYLTGLYEDGLLVCYPEPRNNLGM